MGHRRSILSLRIANEDKAPPLSVLCAGFEDGHWRCKALARDILNAHLISFALPWSEAKAVDADTAADDLTRAAKEVYGTDKYLRRGEFGELILHAIVRDFFDADTAICKIYFKTARNDTVKGFDSVHVVQSRDGSLELWLGEVKFYKDLNAAIRDVVVELTAHLTPDYLRDEFTLITNKLDPNWPHQSVLRDLLHKNTSLDQIRAQIVVPVCLTYESKSVATATALDVPYVDGLQKEADAAWQYWATRYNLDVDVRLHLLLVPLHDKDDLAGHMHERLIRWQED